MKKMLALLMVLLMVLPGMAAGEGVYDAYRAAAEKAENALADALWAEQQQLYVYKDFADSENHYTQKMKMWGYNESLVHDMNENWRENPHSGFTCIRCEQTVVADDWGGWAFVNGMLPEGSTQPVLNNGMTPDQGLNLSGAQELRFWARGENGGEKVEFFTCGFFQGQNVPYPDSAEKCSLGMVELTPEWEEYVIDVSGEDMSYIALGFGFVLAGSGGAGDKVFYLDDIRFTGKPEVISGGYYLLRSYTTDNQYIYNAAFTYDNALAAMAFLSAGRTEEAEKILDSFVFAIENDRWMQGRIRNAYVAGNISSFTGWAEQKKARLPGWYDTEANAWYEDQYQTGSNVGNTSYAALALLQYDNLYNSPKYREAAKALMEWVIDECTPGEGFGFTSGYQGWPEAGEAVTYVDTYKSIEHNIDAYAAFIRLYTITGNAKYKLAANSALEFIRSMYNADEKRFYTGTESDGVTPSTDNTVLDAQVWCCMSLGDEFAPYMDSLETVEAMKTDGGYPFCRSNANGGWWAEGTAYTALMYRILGDDEKAAAALDALVSIQLENGKFPAATVDNLSTGFWLFTGDPWEYGSAPHIAPTAWFVMAVNGFNPYTFRTDAFGE